MKIPKYIKDKIHRAGKLSLESLELQKEIITWFQDKGIDFNEDTHGQYARQISGGEFANDQLVEAMLTGETEFFIEFMEEERFRME